MTIETSVRVAPRDHVVLFYENAEELVTMVAQFAFDGLSADETVVMVATTPHLAAFDDALVADGIDIDAARAEGSLLTLDAFEAMSHFVVGGRPDAERFRTELGALIRQLTDSGRRVRIYGEMVTLLWDAGNVTAAIELEALWNELGKEMPFSLFCAYPAASVADDDGSVEQICQCHSAVLSGERTEATQAFPAEPKDLSRARQFVVDTLRSWSLGRVADDAAIIVSELATNAILHAASDFVVALSLQSDCVRLSVRDASAELPVTRAPSPSTISGRGLILISALADSWGTESVDDGKVVWVDLRV